MFDILLINPPLVDYAANNNPKYLINTSFFPPINLAYLSSYLQQFKFKTKIIDMDAEKYCIKQIIDLIRIYKPKVIGIGITSDIIFPISLKIINYIKSNFELKIIVGGVFPSNNPEYILKESRVDFLVRGEGEETLLELMNFLIYNIGTIDNIKGISYIKDQVIPIEN